MRCLITGITGFVGRHLTHCLLNAGHTVAGLARRPATMAVPVHVVDLLDTVAVEQVIRAERPDWLFHLAGFASPGQSFKNPTAAWASNLHATQSLYEALTRTNQRPRILFVSSGLIYGDAPNARHAFTEIDPLYPASPYAASKAAADLLSYQQTRNPGLDIVRVRPFNHIGPGHSAEYAASNFAKQIAAIQRGLAPPLVRTGDLSAQRDLTDVRDMVRAYVRLMEVGQMGEAYNAGSGQTYSMRDLLQRLIRLAGVHAEVQEAIDPTRTGDTTVSMANTDKLRTATRWHPDYTLDQTLADLLADWRRQLGAVE